MARILLAPIGTSGDVNPFVGIGVHLQQRGHDVFVVTLPHYRSLVEAAGLPLVPVGTEQDFEEVIRHPDLWHPEKGLAIYYGLCLKLMPDIQARVSDHYEPGSSVLVAPRMNMGARVAHENPGIPLLTLVLNPLLIRSAIRPPKLPHLKIPKWGGRPAARLVFYLSDRKMKRLLLPRINEFRGRLGLRSIGDLQEAFVSPQRIVGVWPDWYSPPQRDWPRQAVVTGFVPFDGVGTVEHEADPEFSLDTIDPANPPVVFTAGTAMGQAAEFFAAAAGAVEKLGRPGLLLAQHGDQLPTRLPPDVLHVRFAPFRELLPRAAALVHHGGIGTTARGLEAGIPQVITPFAFDQFDNADLLGQLGVSRTLKRAELSASSLAETLRELIGSEEVTSRCRELSQRLRDADPIALTADHIEALIGGEQA